MHDKGVLDTQIPVGGDGLNSVEIKSVTNAVTVSLFDVYTTTYFLSESMLLEEHKEAGDTT